MQVSQRKLEKRGVQSYFDGIRVDRALIREVEEQIMSFGCSRPYANTVG